MNARAFAPGNVSCIFRIVGDKDLSKRHSLGVGFTLDKGVIVKAEAGRTGRTEIYADGKRIVFPTVMDVIGALTKQPVRIEIRDQLPAGAGFGISGASALASAYAINSLLGLGKDKKELAMIAHSSEAANGTGLGDVGGQFHGGFNMKLKKGKPLEGVSFGVEGIDVYYRLISRIKTKDIINDTVKARRINKAGDRALKKAAGLFLQAKRSRKAEGRLSIKAKKELLGRVIRISKDFSAESGLLTDKRVKNLIKAVEDNGGNASMMMLGNAVFADIPFRGCSKAKISKRGAELI
ncbi:hypothetical protein KY358_00905 [Candidatus Woesearchaeota archaeon]|nr:hypothetical protein [Candidatus Woesearchaeota archaeon]